MIACLRNGFLKIYLQLLTQDSMVECVKGRRQVPEENTCRLLLIIAFGPDTLNIRPSSHSRMFGSEAKWSCSLKFIDPVTYSTLEGVHSQSCRAAFKLILKIAAKFFEPA